MAAANGASVFSIFCSFTGIGIGRLDAHPALQPSDEGKERAVLITRGAAAAEPVARLACHALLGLRHEPGLADARVGADDHHLALSGARVAPSPDQQIELFLPADEAGHLAGQGLHPGVEAGVADDAVRADLLSRRRQPQRSAGRGLEEAFDERIEDVADHDGIERGDLLQADGDLRRLPIGQLRERRLAAGVGDHAAGMDAHADRHADPELVLHARAQLGAALHDRQPGAHGAAVVILVRGRIAE